MTKAEVKKIDGTKREVNIEVSGDRVKNKFEEAFTKIAATAKVPGFRPGHAPRDILEKNFSRHAEELVLKELIPDVYDEVVKQEELEVIELPQISEVKLERSLLKFKAVVEVHPDIQLKNYKGIKINYRKTAVSADDIKRSLDSLRESRKLDNLDDSFARSIGYPSMQELESSIEKQIFIQKESQRRQEMESELIEKLTSELDFKVPAALVSRQLEELVRQAKVNLAIKGVERAKIEEQDKQLRSQLEPEAKRQVKNYLVLAHIAKKEKISTDDHMPQRVIEFLLREADWQAG